MTQPLLGLLRPDGPALYYDHLCRITFETHMKYLREHAQTQPVALEPSKVHKYQGDLNGYLSDVLEWDYQYHWVIMRMNNKNTPADFGLEDTFLLTPAPSVIRAIEALINTSPSKPR